MTQQIFSNLDIFENQSNIQAILTELQNNFAPEIRNLNSRIAFDLGLLFIYRRLSSDADRKNLIRFWRQHSPPKTIHLPMGEFNYRPYLDFIALDNIMNGLYIETVIEQLNKFQSLSFYESCAILSDIERYHIVPLSEMDVKIITCIRDLLLEKKTFTNSYLSEKLNVRSNYISRRLSHLRNNAYFRITGTVNFPKIGLHQYIILLESFPALRDSIPAFFVSPYTRTIRRCPNQRFDYIISLTLPKKIESNLFEYLNRLKEKAYIRSFYCDEVIAISNNLSFEYYSYSKRPSVKSGNKAGFHIDWFKERIRCMENLQKETSFHHYSFGGKRLKISVKDLKILTLYRRDLNSSVRHLAQKLDYSWEDTNRYIERAQKILFPMVMLYYTGLNQTAILFLEKINSTQLAKFEAILNRMPQVFCYSFKHLGAIATIDLMNGAHRLNDLLNEMFLSFNGIQFSLASKTSGIFRPIPFKYFNQKDQEWFFPEDFFLFNKLKENVNLSK